MKTGIGKPKGTVVELIGNYWIEDDRIFFLQLKAGIIYMLLITKPGGYG